MDFKAPVGTVDTTGPQAEIKAIKADLVQSMVAQGLPDKLYLVLSVEPLEGAIECTPTISQTTGQILYNFGKSVAVEGCATGVLRGNFFMPKDPWTVSPEDLSEYRSAKKRAELAKQANSR